MATSSRSARGHRGIPLPILLVVLIGAATAAGWMLLGGRFGEVSSSGVEHATGTGHDPVASSAEVASRAASARTPAPAHASAGAPAAPLNIYAAATATEVQPRLRGLTPRVYVPNTVSDTIDVLDQATGRVLESYPVGDLPHHVAPSWDMRSLYVDNTEGNSLTEIDIRTGRPIRTIPVEDPYNLYFTPDGTKAIVVAERFQRLDFRDPHTWRLIRSVPLPGSGGDHLDFSADGSSLLISDEFSGDLVRVDTVRMRVTGSVHVGGLPVDIKLSPDGTRYFVANQGDRSGVHVIDARTLRERSFVPTGAGAHGLAYSRDSRTLFVSNRDGGSISRIDSATGRLKGTWRTGGSPDMLQVSTDGTELWTSDRYGTTVSVYDTTSGALARRIEVGSQPHGIALFPQPGRYSLGHNGVYR